MRGEGEREIKLPLSLFHLSYEDEGEFRIESNLTPKSRIDRLLATTMCFGSPKSLIRWKDRILEQSLGTNKIFKDVSSNPLSNRDYGQESMEDLQSKGESRPPTSKPPVVEVDLDIQVRRDPTLAMISLVHRQSIYNRANPST